MASPRLVIHVGMPRTGTTALQEVLAEHDGRFWTAAVPHATFGTRAPALMHLSVRECARAAALQGPWGSLVTPRIAEYEHSRELWSRRVRAEERASLGRWLDQAHDLDAVLSLEQLSLLRGAARLLDRWDCRRENRIVVAVIRPVDTLLVSTLQQALRQPSLSVMNAGRHWPANDSASSLAAFLPSFRRAVEPWDLTVGKDRVRIVDYRRGSAAQRNSPAAVLRAVDLPVPVPDESHSGSTRINRAVPAEQSAVLAAGLCRGWSRAEHRVASALLVGFGKRRLAVHPAALDRIAARRSIDLEWIERRTGLSIREPIAESDTHLSVGSMHDLARAGDALVGEVRDHLEQVWGVASQRSDDLVLMLAEAAAQLRPGGPVTPLVRLPAIYSDEAFCSAFPVMRRSAIGPSAEYQRQAFDAGFSW